MKHDIFQNMREQMVPSEHVTDDLINKISALKKPVRNKKKWIAGAVAAACVAAALPCAVILPGLLKSTGVNIAKCSSESAASALADSHAPTISRIPGWDERSLPNQYDQLYINKTLFVSNEKEADAKKIDRFLFKTTLTGYDYTDPNFYLNPDQAKQYTMNAQVYSVKKMNKDCIVAVKYEGQDNFYFYTRSGYTAQTFGRFIDDFNLTENLVIEAILYDDGKKTEYALTDQTNLVWDFLSSSRSAEYTDPNELGQFGGELGIAVSMTPMPNGIEKCQIGVSKSGYLFTNLLGNLQAFHVGKDRAAALISDVLTRGQAQDAQP